MNQSLGIFLKAGGVRQESGAGTGGAGYTDHGCYVTSTLGSSGSNCYVMEFTSTSMYVGNAGAWFSLLTNGYLVRCVKGTKQ